MGNTWSGNPTEAGSTPSDLSLNASRRQRGATLMEFAIIMPLLVALLIGIVESGWIFAQYLDVRHGAREGARIAAVNFPEGSDPPSMARTDANRDALVAETCSRMSVASAIDVTFTSTGAAEAPISVAAEAPADTLTGLLDWAFGSLSVSSSTVLHAEQEATWTNTDPGGQSC